MTPADVVKLDALAPAALAALRERFLQAGLRWIELPAGAAIPGSYWGESEAGLVGDALYVRPDTPLHSALHEGCHFLCLDASRRDGLHTDAGGDDLEECAVCYLQCLLADGIAGYSRERMWRDMDAWGYSFRLGSARDWFEQDAADARRWLERRGLLPEGSR
ncbi:MAG TPA: hypothetical protein VM369_08725 [Candidatus Binatia bacterium]|nr:hypothetical protein [Candidatus Binatia bacterium]